MAKSKYQVKIGDTYNYLTAVSEVRSKTINRTTRKNTVRVADWKCKCGSITEQKVSEVCSGRIKSCGCYNREAASKRMLSMNEPKRHDLVGHPLYGSWKTMKTMAYNPKSPVYVPNITVYEEWKGSFKNFYNWSINNGWQENYVLTRKDRTQGFYPENCMFRLKYPGLDKITGKKWFSIVRNAKTRGINFDIGIDYAIELFYKQKQLCYYTGDLIYLDKDNTASLDRIDSSLGYIIGNVCWCHKTINKIKFDYTVDRFIELCNMIIHPQQHTLSEISSGCEQKYFNNYYRGCGNIRGTIWRAIIRGAKDRKLPFNITIEQAWDKFMEQRGFCAITGCELKFHDYVGKSEKGHSTYANGNASLDRIDSSRGYEPDNIQWVHMDINIMKWELPLDELKYWCRKVVEHQTQ